MGRRIIYRVEDRPENRFTEEAWLEVERLQHWYNSEFQWSTGRINFKRFVLFPNAEDLGGPSSSIWEIISRRHEELKDQGLHARDIIAQMERENLVVVKWGGYYDGSLASGFTRVADNEWNAFLVCDFLLKASTLLPGCLISVQDEGQFIKTGSIKLRDGSIVLKPQECQRGVDIRAVCDSRHVFSIVDADKYARHPSFRNMIPEYGSLREKEKRQIVRNWNWLGYEGRYDVNGDDKRGYNLNDKVRSFLLALEE